jgi:hypothetical protein
VNINKSFLNWFLRGLNLVVPCLFYLLLDFCQNILTLNDVVLLLGLVLLGLLFKVQLCLRNSLARSSRENWAQWRKLDSSTKLLHMPFVFKVLVKVVFELLIVKDGLSLK